MKCMHCVVSTDLTTYLTRNLRFCWKEGIHYWICMGFRGFVLYVSGTFSFVDGISVLISWDLAYAHRLLLRQTWQRLQDTHLHVFAFTAPSSIPAPKIEMFPCSPMQSSVSSVYKISRLDIAFWLYLSFHLSKILILCYQLNYVKKQLFSTFFLSKFCYLLKNN